MIFAETPRLHLRALEESDLPRLTELIGDWDVAKWLLVVPHPYDLKDAGEFFEIQRACYAAGKPEFFALAGKTGNEFMGGVGLRPAYVDPRPEEIVLGYWLGRPYWGKGFMSEAVKTAIAMTFRRPEIQVMISATDPANQESQNVLKKAGLKCLGTFPRAALGLRGGPDETRWELRREDYKKAEGPA
jgi:RimJ/RimL family protein N-acetyltransferase